MYKQEPELYFFHPELSFIQSPRGGDFLHRRLFSNTIYKCFLVMSWTNFVLLAWSHSVWFLLGITSWDTKNHEPQSLGDKPLKKRPHKGDAKVHAWLQLMKTSPLLPRRCVEEDRGLGWWLTGWFPETDNAWADYCAESTKHLRPDQSGLRGNYITMTVQEDSVHTTTTRQPSLSKALQVQETGGCGR